MFSKMMIMGRLAFDPKCSDTKSGKRMCSMSVPIDTGYGENKSTLWYKVLVFGKQAEACEKYLHKGDTVLAMGELSADLYDGKDGQKKLALTIMADTLSFGPKGSGTDAGQQGQSQPGMVNPDDNPFVNPYAVTDIPF